MLASLASLTMLPLVALMLNEMDNIGDCFLQVKERAEELLAGHPTEGDFDNRPAPTFIARRHPSTATGGKLRW